MHDMYRKPSNIPREFLCRRSCRQIKPFCGLSAPVDEECFRQRAVFDLFFFQQPEQLLADIGIGLLIGETDLIACVINDDLLEDQLVPDDAV